MKLIVNADDFGRSRAVNEAVVRGHREGVLTGASLMVTGGAWREAVGLARRMSSLAVGLHLVVVDGRSLLCPGRLHHLVDARGEFRGGAPARLARSPQAHIARVPPSF